MLTLRFASTALLYNYDKRKSISQTKIKCLLWFIHRKEFIMKITIVCANGRAGKLILEEAVNRGHEVTAIVRNNRDLPDTVNIIEKDLFDITLNEIGRASCRERVSA